MKKYPIHLANNFNSKNPIKKRIIMMYSKHSSRARLFRFLSLMPVILIGLIMLACSKEVTLEPKEKSLQSKSQTTAPTKIVPLKLDNQGYGTLAKKQIKPNQKKMPYIFSKNTEYMLKVLDNDQPVDLTQKNLKVSITKQSGERVILNNNGTNASEIKFKCDETAVYNVNIQGQSARPLELKVLFKSRR